MKGLKIIAVLLPVIAQSCEKYTLSRVYRAVVMADHAQKSKDTVQVQPAAEIRDTTVYVSAVIVPDDYDWRRDSSYGAVSCELQLLKNGVPQFTVGTGPESGVGISPDTHHLTGGHLYTEFTSPEGTVICRDGQEVFRYSQREALNGLLVKGEDIYTLGRNLDGSGFAFRKNGEVLFRKDSGKPFGSFSNPACGRSGGLYERKGSVCFAFKTASACYYVLDGEMTQVRTGVSASRILDLRLFDTGVYYVADYRTSIVVFGPDGSRTLPSDVTWSYASLFPRGDAAWLNAESRSWTLCRPAGQAGDGQDVKYTGGANYIYNGPSGLFAVSHDSGSVQIRNEDGELLYVRDSSYFLSPGCAFFGEGGIYAAVNPREPGLSPSVWHDGREDYYDINGYLTSVEVEISPPN